MKKTYESPKFGFQEMKLFERVADECWGTAQIWLDTNGDHSITDADVKLTTGGGCHGNASAKALNDKISEFNAMATKFNETQDISGVQSYNSYLAQWILDQKGGSDKVIYLNTINATADSNWANTKEKSGSGIIIIPS